MKAPLPPPTKPTLSSLLGIDNSPVVVLGLFVFAQNLILPTVHPAAQPKEPPPAFQGLILRSALLFGTLILILISRRNLNLHRPRSYLYPLSSLHGFFHRFYHSLVLEPVLETRRDWFARDAPVDEVRNEMDVSV